MVGRAMGKNNAFGDGSPSWNLSFPDGNMTAAELLAYTPHWLKSIDVILRLVNHGGRAVVVAHLISKYRDTVKAEFHPNSACVMMHYAMRRAGNEDWTINTRSNYPQERVYDEDSLYVGDFRPPRVTHPKSVPAKLKCKQSEHSRNAQVGPIPFKDLALHVKEHPSGADALDLTRCVLYGIENPEEQWLFPDDFKELVDHLGGPLTVTYSHLDRQIFARYDHLFGAPHPRWRRGPPRGSGRGRKRPRTNTTNQDSDTEHNSDDPEIKTEENDDEGAYQTARLNRSNTMRPTRPSLLDGGRNGAGPSRNDNGPRRSGRRVQKTPVYTERDEFATDDEDEDYISPRRKRQQMRTSPQLTDEESEFEAKDEPESEEEPMTAFDEEVDELFSNNTSPTLNQRSTPHQPHSSLGKVSKSESDMLMQQFEQARATASNAHPTSEQMSAAAAWIYQVPTFVKPPVLSLDRLTIDAWNVHLYAAEGCHTPEQQWASALSFYRFEGGPRTSPPFRELHRLTKPAVWDTDDFAENVRWAQQQYKLYNVDTWTEYDAHLELITKIRQSYMWFSEESICAKIQW